MNTPSLPQRIPESPTKGATASFSRTITEADVALFVGVTWDVNPLHTDDVYMRAMPFKRRIVPGLLTASLLTHLGGLWAFLATEMNLTFMTPVFIGDTITAKVEVLEIDEGRGWVRLGCRCRNEEGTDVLQGEILGHPGRFEV
jgi:3-hydroxybutyryl-CoA dehydratase